MTAGLHKLALNDVSIPELQAKQCGQIRFAPEKSSIRRLIFDTIRQLRKDNVKTTDLGSRYARLLELLWQRAHDNVTQPGTSVGSSPESIPEARHISNQSFREQEDFSWLESFSLL